MTRNCCKMIEQTGYSLLLSKHSIQLSALFLLLSGYTFRSTFPTNSVKVQRSWWLTGLLFSIFHYARWVHSSLLCITQMYRKKSLHFRRLVVVLNANSQNLMIFSAVLVLLALNQGHCTRKLGRRPHMWYEVGLMQSNITTVYTIWQQALSSCSLRC